MIRSTPAQTGGLAGGRICRGRPHEQEAAAMGDRVVVTGASTGIGRAAAVAFHDAGFDVVATMRDVAAGETLPCRVEALDVTSNESVERLFDLVRPVDVLVSNAGVGAPGSCEDLDVEYVHEVMDTNFYGAIRCTRKVLPEMRERRSGCLVYTTSIAGRVASPIQGTYHASKFALEAWAESLAYEMAPFGVRIALVEPGFVLTPIFSKQYRQPSAAYVQATNRMVEFLLAQARHGTTPEDVGKVIVEAASTDRPRLRWLVGPDAHQMYERAARTSEEDLIGLYGIQDDDAYWAKYEKIFGPEITPRRN
jgi:NAD(P)-dependent dehydrogenase (short-subunit alcohol dehydrogenase family)